MKLAAGCITLMFLSALFAGLFFMSSSMHMSGGMTDCPFMLHDEVVCSMNFVDHIGAWKATFISLIPTFILFVAVGALAFVFAVAPHLLLKPLQCIPILFRYIRERIYTFPYRPLQEFFSNGILHPKLF